MLADVVAIIGEKVYCARNQLQKAKNLVYDVYLNMQIKDFV